MDYGIAMEYYIAITAIEAEKTLIDLNVSDYPRMKKDGRNKLHRSLLKAAYGPNMGMKELSFEEFRKKVNG